jgi:hypothetical protein
MLLVAFEGAVPRLRWEASEDGIYSRLDSIVKNSDCIASNARVNNEH